MSQHHHGGVVRVGEGCTGTHGLDAGLLGGVHEVVELALQRREGAVDRQGACDVGRVEVVALDAHVEQHELTPVDRPGVVDPVQRSRVGAATDDRVIADVVAHRPRPPEEGALHPALAELQHPVPLRDGVGEPEGGDVAGGLELGHLPLVLEQPHLRGHAGEVGVAALVGGDELVDGLGHTAVDPGLAAARQVVTELVDVAHLESEGVGDLLQRRASAHPQLAVLPVAEELVGVAIRAGASVEDALAAVDDQHGVAGLVAAEVGVGGVGAEPVVGVVGPHLEAARGQDETFAREGLGEPLTTSRGVRRDRVGRELQLAVTPALAHEGGVRRGHGRVVRLGVQHGLAGLVGGRVGGLFAHARKPTPAPRARAKGKVSLR